MNKLEKSIYRKFKKNDNFQKVKVRQYNNIVVVRLQKLGKITIKYTKEQVKDGDHYIDQGCNFGYSNYREENGEAIFCTNWGFGMETRDAIEGTLRDYFHNYPPEKQFYPVNGLHRTIYDLVTKRFHSFNELEIQSIGPELIQILPQQ